MAAPGVLANDTDVDGNPLTAVLVTGSTHGTLTLNSNGSFTYALTGNYNGADRFTYRANDGTANWNTATVSITVNAVNDAPVAANDSYSTNEDTTLTVSAPAVLANDTDVDGNPLTASVVASPTHGTLTLNSNGSFTYIPATSSNGSDSFTYRANDGTASSNTATVSVTVSAADRTAPSMPTNPTATAISSSQINLSWSASTDNVGVTGYKVYRAGTQIGTSATTSYSDTGLSPSTTYTYTLYAYDAAGNSSSPSTPASATTQSIGSSTGYPRLSADGTYIVDQNNQPFFIVGDAAWSLIAQLNNADTVTYLSDRSSRGFNTIITNLLEHKFASRLPLTSTEICRLPARLSESGESGLFRAR